MTTAHSSPRLENALLALILLFGTLFAFLTPPFQAPDEPQHFFRAFEISEGRVVPIARDGQSGDELPASLPHVAGALIGDVPFHAEIKVSVAAIRAAANHRLEARTRTFVPFLTSAYSFVPYLPQALGIAIARLFSDSVLTIFYAGRLGNVGASALLLSLALRAVPLGRPIFFLLAMAPMQVFLAASESADAFTNAFCFLFIALVLRYACSQGHRLEPSSATRFLLLSIVLGLAKPGYILLSLLFLFVPSRRVGSARNRALFAGAMAAASAAAVLAWSFTIRNVYPPFQGVLGLDPARQLRAVLTRPLDAAGMAVAFFWRQAPVLANQYIGKLGWIDTHLPPVFVVAFFLSLFAVGATSGCEGPAMSRGQRATLLVVFFLSLAWLTALLYIVFTPYGARFIGSTQGRYFIPLGPVALLTLLNRRRCIAWRDQGRWLIGWAAIMEFVALASVARRFYV